MAVRKREGDSISVLQRTVAARKAMGENARGFWEARYLRGDGERVLGGLDGMEVTVNYLGVADAQGRSGNGEEDGGLFDMSRAVEGGLGAEGHEVKGFSLFSITAEVRGGKLGVVCSWSKKMKRQGGIRRWFFEYGNALRDVAHQVRKREAGRG